MLISFKKIPQSGIDFKVDTETIKFEGKLFKESKTLAQCKGFIRGEVEHYCDRCGQDINIALDENIELYFHDGIYENQDDSLDVVEFFSNEIDLNEVLQSEVTSIKSGYFYCSTCKDVS